MPKVSKESATQVADLGIGEEHAQDVDGYQISFVSLREESDLAPLLQGLPDDKCPCPHWGYMLAGEITWSYGSVDETVSAGDAFYIPPGHTPRASAGSEFVLFSPAELAHEVDEHIARNVQAMQSA